MGSSLGGYYALNLAERFGLRAVLINPSLHPWETLAAHTGEAVNYYDGARFQWTPEHVQNLKRYRISTVSHPENILLMLQTGDEVLDYNVALEALPGAVTLVEKGGDHTFEGFDRHLSLIQAFSPRQLREASLESGLYLYILW